MLRKGKYMINIVTEIYDCFYLNVYLFKKYHEDLHSMALIFNKRKTALNYAKTYPHKYKKYTEYQMNKIGKENLHGIS